MPKPTIEDGEVLVKVVASGILCTDVMNGIALKSSTYFGHEIAGDIVESKSKKYKVGRGFCYHHVACVLVNTVCRKHTACETLHTVIIIQVLQRVC